MRQQNTPKASMVERMQRCGQLLKSMLVEMVLLLERTGGLTPCGISRRKCRKQERIV